MSAESPIEPTAPCHREGMLFKKFRAVNQRQNDAVKSFTNSSGVTRDSGAHGQISLCAESYRQRGVFCVRCVVYKTRHLGTLLTEEYQ